MTLSRLVPASCRRLAAPLLPAALALTFALAPLSLTGCGDSSDGDTAVLTDEDEGEAEAMSTP